LFKSATTVSPARNGRVALSPPVRPTLNSDSYKEVADHLGISVKTVEKHISRAMRETNGYLKVRYSATRPSHG
jgi:hypothetical protein